MAYAILRTSKIKTPAGAAGMNRHLIRDRSQFDIPNADKDLEKLNRQYVGTDNLYQDIQDRIKASGVEKVRKNAVLAVEHLMTFSPEFAPLSKNEEIDKNGEKKYFLSGNGEDVNNVHEFARIARLWMEETYGKENVISVHLHLDEKTPHIHAYATPILEKTNARSGKKSIKLDAQNWTGNKTKLSGLQDTFAEKMKPLGLERGIKGSKAKHISIQKYYATLNKAEKIVDSIDLKIPTKEELPALMRQSKVLEILENVKQEAQIKIKNEVQKSAFKSASEKFREEQYKTLEDGLKGLKKDIEKVSEEKMRAEINERNAQNLLASEKGKTDKAWASNRAAIELLRQVALKDVSVEKLREILQENNISLDQGSQLQLS